MAFEELDKRNRGERLKRNEISIRAKSIGFGKLIAEEIKSGDYIRFFIDEDNRKLAFRKTTNKEKGYLVAKHKNKTMPLIHTIAIIKDIQKKRYEAYKQGNLWVINFDWIKANEVIK